MKKSDAILKISAKLQKQMHLINSELMRDNPKMLCDNLATRVMTEVEEIGMRYCEYFPHEGNCETEWEPEDEEK